MRPSLPNYFSQTRLQSSSLYASGQCILSVIGSVGVILLFAGIPQIIYSPAINPMNLATFIVGALLIGMMVAGNAFIGHKYRQLLRARREDRRSRGSRICQDDKPPSYDELIRLDGLPPDYSTVMQQDKQPPKYTELVNEVINWSAIALAAGHSPSNSRMKSDPQMPIIAPVHNELEKVRQASTSKDSPKQERKTEVKIDLEIIPELETDSSSTDEESASESQAFCQIQTEKITYL